MTDLKQPFSRRRLLAGAGVGTAAVWAAPAITTLGRAGAAGANGSCVTVYETLFGNLSSPPDPVTYTTPTTLTFGTSTLTLTSGSANLTGPNSSFVSGFPSVPALDLNGEGQGGGTTVLETNLIPAGTYTVELSIGGAFPNGTSDNNNSLSVNFGGLIFNFPAGLPPNDPISTHTASATIGVATALTLTHVDSAPGDNIGMFLGGIRICKSG